MMSMSSMNSIQIRVLVASTGISVPVSLFPHELTVANIRRHLAGVVPIQDQILLLGPPYKVPKDATLQSQEILASLRVGDLEDDMNRYEDDYCNTNTSEGTLTSATLTRRQKRKPFLLGTNERVGARRLFLFSKQALSDLAADPTPCILLPADVTLPSEPDPSPISLRSASDSSSSSSPLFQALQLYERGFMLKLCHGRVFADAADMRISSCRNCISEQVVMARALRAAVSNLADHRNAATRTRTEFTDYFQSTTFAHSNLLSNFEKTLTSLANVPLHPTLIAIARTHGRGEIQTLLDTVPVERERAWAYQCQLSHSRLLALFSELNTAFSQIGNRASMDEEVTADIAAETNIKALSDEVEGHMANVKDLQAERLERLVAEHKEVMSIILRALDGGEGADIAHAAFARFESMGKASADIVPSMISDDESLKLIMSRVADAKTEAMMRMKHRLRQVSISQSAIQRVLANVSVLRDALSQQCENMTHLEHVAELHSAYRDFIAEVRRRRAYGSAVTSTASALMERLSLIRADEVKARETFIHGSGRHLMPAFFEIFVPTLASPPPLFTPQLPAVIELDNLPNFGSLYDESITNKRHSNDLNTNEDDTTDSPFDAATENASNHDSENYAVKKKQPLAVSADDTSRTDIIMGSASHDDTAESGDVERKTLAYENAVLRQIVERLSGKTTNSYLSGKLEESFKKMNFSLDKDKGATFSNEIEQLKRELELTKGLLNEAAGSLAEVKKAEKMDSKLCDKISHSSFNIGDVALFMPTGRGGTYLAFHTNCPHRYLSTDCIRGTPNFVLGRIVMQEQLVAGETAVSNPHGLNIGTKFWILTVEVLKVPS